MALGIILSKIPITKDKSKSHLNPCLVEATNALSPNLDLRQATTQHLHEIPINGQFFWKNLFLANLSIMGLLPVVALCL